MKLLRLILFALLVWGIWYACRSNQNIPSHHESIRQESSSSTKEKQKSCQEGSTYLANSVAEIAENLSAQQLGYNSLPFTDCSGIFHRVLDSLRLRCPEQAFPDKSYRSSRDLAKWYHEQGQLILVFDALNNSDLIKPGAVLFFGGSGAEWGDAFTLEQIVGPGGINHVGIVTFVEKDSHGIVQSYRLFHGLRPGKAAQITHWHTRNPSREIYPPFGNGTEPWLAIAPVVGK